ncbi:uncharacterized protein LOC130657166 [Hydractinia symbiolongicarpus]|uniref:uncharacterized protein LOC130657166 n=1 Tax=Hydractinia symbiolongicarpus TaxID=13093 RepID=UPI002551942E|nr:uncharacterized protein LOC130657166 [Hydractinia symbiolongicarpus]
MKGRIVLLLSLLCVAQALPLSLDENTRASLTRGKRHEHHHHHHEHSEIADREVRTIISAIVDAILDGDRKKRSDIPEEEDDVTSDMSSESGSGEASGDYERVSVPKNIKDVKGANDDPEYVGNIFQKSDEESTDATKILKLDSVSESGENVGSGSGSDSDLNVESETESGAESGSGSESGSESESGLESGSGSESSKKRSEVSETNDLEQSGDSESGSSGSGEDADTSGEFNSGSGDNEIVGIVGDENARLIDDDISKRTNTVGDNEGRMKRDEDGLDEQDRIESKARQEKEKKDLISNINAQLSKSQNKTQNIENHSLISNSENDSDNESGSGSGETSESGSGDFSLEKRNSVLEKRSQIVQEDNFGKLVNELDNDNTDTPDNDSENESDDTSGNESGSQSSTESGDSTNSDSFTEPPDKRSILRGEDNKYTAERYAAKTYSEEESESGIDSDSGSGSSDGSGSPWDSASGFGFEKRETTPLSQQYGNVNNTMRKANESESITEDGGSGNSEKDPSGESGDASSTMDSTLNESDEGYSSGEDDENLQPDEENEHSSAQLEREDKNINDDASLVTMEDSNKSKYGSQSSIKNTEEQPKAEVVSDNEGESESDTDEISGTESESGASGSESESGSGSDARRKNIIHQIVSDMAKAAVDSVEVDDSDSVVKKSNINIPDEVTPTKSNNLATAKRTIENRTFENSTNVNSDDSENITKKGMVNSERDLALKTLVKSVLKDDPSVKASIEELKKRRSESEEKLYRDILGLVQQAPLEPEEDTKEKVITEVKDFEGFVEALSQTENLSSFKHDAIAKKLEKDLLEHLSVTEKDDSTLANQENELLKDTELTHIKERIEDARESSEEYALKHSGSIEEIRRHAVSSLKPIIEALPLKKEDVDDLAKLIGKSAWVKMITHTKRKAHIRKKIRRNLEELFALK